MNEKSEISQWISVNDKLPRTSCIIQVKMTDDRLTLAYYHHDKMGWAHSYAKFPWTHFQEKSTLGWLENVTHWKPTGVNN